VTQREHANLIFALRRSISTKISKLAVEGTFNKTMQNCPLHLKYMLALPWEIESDRLTCQRTTYMYILMNHRIATNMTGSYCLKNCQTCSKSHQLYILCSKCLPPARTQAYRRWHHVTKSPTACSINRLFTHSPCVLSVCQHLRSWCALECKDDVTYYMFNNF